MKAKGILYLKRTGILLGLGFLGLVIWANWKAPTITERLEKVNMLSFDLSQVKNPLLIERMDEELTKTKGVSAVTVSYSSKMLAVVFYPRVLTMQALQAKLEVWAQEEVPLKVFNETSGGCPVHGLAAFAARLKSGLCFRH